MAGASDQRDRVVHAAEGIPARPRGSRVPSSQIARPKHDCIVTRRNRLAESGALIAAVMIGRSIVA